MPRNHSIRTLAILATLSAEGTLLQSTEQTRIAGVTNPGSAVYPDGGMVLLRSGRAQLNPEGDFEDDRAMAGSTSFYFKAYMVRQGKIAFTAVGPDRRQLFTMDLETGRATQIPLPEGFSLRSLESDFELAGTDSDLASTDREFTILFDQRNPQIAVFHHGSESISAPAPIPEPVDEIVTVWAPRGADYFFVESKTYSTPEGELGTRRLDKFDIATNTLDDTFSFPEGLLIADSRIAGQDSIDLDRNEMVVTALLDLPSSAVYLTILDLDTGKLIRSGRVCGTYSPLGTSLKSTFSRCTGHIILSAYNNILREVPICLNGTYHFDSDTFELQPDPEPIPPGGFIGGPKCARQLVSYRSGSNPSDPVGLQRITKSYCCPSVDRGHMLLPIFDFHFTNDSEGGDLLFNANTHGQYHYLRASQRNYLKGTKVSLDQPGAIQSVSLYVHDPFGNVVLSVYRDGPVLERVWASEPIYNGSYEYWLTATAPPEVNLGPGDYWLCWQVDSLNDVPSFVQGTEGTGFQIDTPLSDTPATMARGEATFTDHNWAMNMVLGPVPPAEADGLLVR
ncbi:MAG: hypothetical protein SF028_00495 [Candidatus Sumerlaeia bacterium]|nr:hypothetical protein [Candidatus Sumerlaeia bacterium]